MIIKGRNSVSKKSELFDSLVLPVLNYAAEIWGAHDAPDIEVIHTKFCRKLLTVKRSTNLNALYGELGRVPMLIHRKIIMIKYWLRIVALHVSYKRKYVHKLLVNRLFKPAQERVWLGELTVPQ